MEVLAFDIASGGVSAARFDEQLKVTARAEVPWSLSALEPQPMQAAFQEVAQQLLAGAPPAAIAIDSFMHAFLLVDRAGVPSLSVQTWLEHAPAAAVELIRTKFGADFHRRTGCRYHPMFPIFKLAAMDVPASQQVVSPKAWFLWGLTREWVEDFGMASASGLFNLHSSEWDSDLLGAARLQSQNLPPLLDRDAIVGHFGQVPVIAGSGDGFMAAIGSGCETGNRAAMTLGTSASVRRLTAAPLLDEEAGTFCYRADQKSFLVGCAGNNGGNVLNWARGLFGEFSQSVAAAVPIFLPMLFGERAPDWNSNLHASWRDLTPDVSIEGLKRSVLDGVVFNLAHYVKILESVDPANRIQEIVLSGNGFREPAVIDVLSAVVDHSVLQPADVGDVTLRGAAMCAWRAIGHDPAPAMEKILQRAVRIPTRSDPKIGGRFATYLQYRAEYRTASRQK